MIRTLADIYLGGAWTTDGRYYHFIEAVERTRLVTTAAHVVDFNARLDGAEYPADTYADWVNEGDVSVLS